MTAITSPALPTDTAKRWLARAAFVLVVVTATSFAYRWIEWPWVAYREGVDALGRSDAAAALREFQSAAEGGVHSRTLSLGMAKAYLQLDRPGEAAAMLEPLRRATPPNPAVTSLLAGILDSENRPAEALHVYLDGADSGLYFPPVMRLHVADLYRRIHRYHDAGAIYRSLPVDAPPDVQAKARLHLAEMLSWERRFDEALALFDEILRADPGNRAARLGRARALSAAGRRAEAISEYRTLTVP